MLVETLVDANHFLGARYQAINSTWCGRMDGECLNHGQAVKEIYVYPLVRDARQRLCGDPTQPGGWR
jgi:Domain of unknown function (DUF4338)